MSLVPGFSAPRLFSGASQTGLVKRSPLRPGRAGRPAASGHGYGAPEGVGTSVSSLLWS